jgi:hypothetical protein
VPATTGAVTELADHLVSEGIDKATVEPTSDYWRIWFYLLEAAGLAARRRATVGRALPVRKPDRIAELLPSGALLVVVSPVRSPLTCRGC